LEKKNVVWLITSTYYVQRRRNMIVALVLKRQFFTLIFAVLLSLFFQVVVEFNWHHSVASPRKPPSRHTDL